MQYILDSASMKKCDQNTMEHYGMLSAVLMERAALSAVEEIVREKPDRQTQILIACGTGNNGGDGIAMARLLFLKGYPVTILFPGKAEKCSVEAKRQLDIACKYGIPLVKTIEEAKADYDVIADALFGIGLDREIGGVYASVISELNKKSGWKVAVDIASGIHADNGSVMGLAFRADLTVTFGFAKIGQLLYPGAEYTGRLEVKDIGIDQKSLLDFMPQAAIYEESDLMLLPRRRAHSNKGSYGKVLVIAGSENMAGAAAFSARAAYRTGAGLVKIVSDAANREILQILVPEAVLSTYSGDTDIPALIRRESDWADAIVLGPGIGLSKQAEEIVKNVLDLAEVPCVIDADALNILAKHTDWLGSRKGPWIITPHPGEMSRLCNTSIEAIQKNMIFVATQFANEYDVITVLKDARTITAFPDGEIRINRTGNHGMATGGSGDVLTGILGTLLAQQAQPELAVPLGVMIHGLAGDHAAESAGKTAMTASDLIEGICQVLP